MISSDTTRQAVEAVFASEDFGAEVYSATDWRASPGRWERGVRLRFPDGAISDEHRCVVHVDADDHVTGVEVDLFVR